LGRSLKEEPVLWEGYRNLRAARNSFAHAGRAVIGTTEVSLEKAKDLLAKANSIVDWLEPSLPADFQWPRERTPVTIELLVQP